LDINKAIPTEEWVERGKQGDSRAFTELYHRYAKELYNSIFRIVQHTGEAEDLLQESFVVAFQQLHQFEQRSSFGAWIKRIAINKAISSLRKKKIRFEELAPDPSLKEEEGIDEATFILKVEAVKKAIASLPEGYRTVVNLYLFDQLPQEEIGELLGISHNTVRTQYHRAKAKIWKTLKEEGHYA
jgi:RNA polymerase sigma factor (sigma-70 family)